MNLRLTLTAGVAVVLASVSLYPVIHGSAWFWAGVGAVLAVIAAGVVTRAPLPQRCVVSSVLALIAVAPMLTASWPLLVLALGIVAVTASGSARPRPRLLRVLSCSITYLAALLIYLNLVFAAGQSVLGVIPTGSSASHLWSLAGQGMRARALAPPVPETAGAVVLAAAGIGLIAVITDLIAVSLRSPAAAGLPLLTLYCVRIATNSQQGNIGSALVFCLGLIGYLALLSAEGRERLRIWGRLVTAWDSSGRRPATVPDQADTRGMSAASRRVGLAAACAALVLPLLIPGIGLHDLLPTRGSGTGPAFSPSGTITLPNPVVQMHSELTASSTQTVLTYTTTAASPPEQYLQEYVLNYNASAGEWTLGGFGRSTQVGGARQLPRPPGLAARTRATHTKTVVNLSPGLAGYESRVAFLPLPYAPATLQVSSGTWADDDATLMVYSANAHLGGLTYTVDSTEANPASAQLAEPPSYPASITNEYLSFPEGTNDELLTLAQQITQGASTPYEKALKLQSYFTSGAFTYNINVSLPNSIAGLQEFLFTTKSGYCQQFAFAMAALARLAGIPSRVAVGFTAGSRAGKHTWKVTTADAHAWPELYFTGVGWLRFEPTPAGADGQGTATVPRYAPAASGGTTSAPPVVGGTGAGIPGIGFGKGGLEGVPHGVAGTAAIPVGHPRSSAAPWLLGVAVLLVLALFTPLSVRRIVRRRRARAPAGAALAHASWRELCDSMADYGIGHQASESPRAVARRISAMLHDDLAACQAATRIASAEERALYAAHPLGSSAPLRGDTVAIRRAIARQVGRGARWRALLLPRSTLEPAREALQHALDVFGWMDVAGLRLRGRIRRRQA